MKKRKKLEYLEKLFLKNKKLKREQIMSTLNVNYKQCRQLVGILRKGTIVLKNGTQKRPPYNIQSVSIKGNQRYRNYELINSNTKPENLKEVLVRTQKDVSTRGKFTFVPTSKTFIKEVPLMNTKRFLLSSQETIIDSYLMENYTKIESKKKQRSKQ